MIGLIESDTLVVYLQLLRCKQHIFAGFADVVMAKFPAVSVKPVAILIPRRSRTSTVARATGRPWVVTIKP
jgi:hypothetical protein